MVTVSPGFGARRTTGDARWPAHASASARRGPRSRPRTHSEDHDDPHGDAGIGQVERRPVVKVTKSGTSPWWPPTMPVAQVAQRPRRGSDRTDGHGKRAHRATTPASTTTPAQRTTVTSRARPLNRLKAEPEL